MEELEQSESHEGFSPKPKFEKSLIFLALAICTVIIIVVVLLVTLGGKSSPVGKYYGPEDKLAAPMIELKSNGTFSWEAYGDEVLHGTYEISGNKLTIYPEGIYEDSKDFFFLEFTIEDNKIMNGDEYVKR